jgi:hypothetical protein
MIITAPELYRYHYVEVDKVSDHSFLGIVWNAPKGSEPLFISPPYNKQSRAHGAAKRFIDDLRKEQTHAI